MPKREHKILEFHGGINNSTDPKDIQDDELREADGVSIHRIGRLVGIGNLDSALTGLATSDNVAVDIEPGFGLHYFSTDYENGEANTPEDWLAIYDKDGDRMRFYYRDKDGTSPSFSGNQITYGSDNNIKPNFYYADGLLRIGDASFSQPSKWFGYLKQSLYWTDESGQDSNLHDIHKWTNGNQKLQSLEELLGDDISIFDASSAGPDATEIGNGSTKKLILSYWTNDGGEWNGNYIFGVTPIYQGEQEGPISQIYDNYVDKVEAVLPLYNNEVIFQGYIPMGTSSSVGADTEHRLGDDRIIGLNWYFKEQGTEDWILLMNTDLKEGGRHFWKAYRSDTESTYGYWTGATVDDSGGDESVSDGVDILYNSGTPNSAIAFYDTVSSNGTASGTNWMTADGTSAPYTDYNVNTTGRAYDNVYIKVKLKNTNANGWYERDANTSIIRKGFLRVWGGAVSPLHVNSVVNSSGNTVNIPLKTGDWDTYYIPIVLPGLGTDREFRIEVLDENFTVIGDSGIETMTITEGNKVKPDDYEQNVDI